MYWAASRWARWCPAADPAPTFELQKNLIILRGYTRPDIMDDPEGQGSCNARQHQDGGLPRHRHHSCRGSGSCRQRSSGHGHRRACGQGGGGVPRACPRRAGFNRAGIAAETDRHQSGAGGCGQGRCALRPSHRAGPACRHRHAAGRRRGRQTCSWRIVASWRHRAGVGHAAGGDGGCRRRHGSDLPAGMRVRGRLGQRSRDSGGAGPDVASQSPSRSSAVARPAARTARST